ncbi:tRNA (guanine(46)-N(7))-methyltransferase TrmB [Aquisalinus flavus]|uniref:tRNA (guanine(46)-N(7))-methyltransferase n=1 Tax=Aquisalinus flavus TaxID=1526572 RepID=A0A8J2Y630_9PROT|nr:methyltransferase domain-containing protein [Aquisalinus flavus]MBD0427901.1 SAM-dependent methyltransferase [Aquisalinus flavus]UNE47660.1 SAM-dependent methyltransferase [Aquisalinus flavus]GGD04779.1 hypothetical protein GCM10011342_12180 [Aquisalinus flavus]
MAFARSRPVTSNQTGIHADLDARVSRYRDTDFRRPPAGHSLKALRTVEAARAAYQGMPVILDSGCGTGDSTRALAEQHPGHLVLGIDRSLARLSRERAPLPANARLVRGNLMDLYPMMAETGWHLDRHYLLYPNPYPKAAHLSRRWHGSPVFPAMLALGGTLELRTNWEIYAKEFLQALTAHHRDAVLAPLDIDAAPLTPFEKKYHVSGHRLYRVLAHNP